MILSQFIIVLVIFNRFVIVLVEKYDFVIEKLDSSLAEAFGDNFGKIKALRIPKAFSNINRLQFHHPCPLAIALHQLRPSQ